MILDVSAGYPGNEVSAPQGRTERGVIAYVGIPSLSKIVYESVEVEPLHVKLNWVPQLNPPFIMFVDPAHVCHAISCQQASL